MFYARSFLTSSLTTKLYYDGIKSLKLFMEMLGETGEREQTSNATLTLILLLTQLMFTINCTCMDKK